MRKDTRTQLLNAAQARFASQGFVGTSIRELAADVGIKESSVYNHFSSKQDLLDEVLARADARLAGVGERFHIPLDDAEAAAPAYVGISADRLEEIASGFLELWLHDPDFVAVRRLLTIEQYRTPGAGQRLRAMLVEGPLDFQTVIFTELIDRGEFLPADPEAVALAFWGPILAILDVADAPGGEPEARRLVRVHLEHFGRTHVTAIAQGKETP